MNSDTPKINHKYYQSGDVIIAGISSQSFMFSNPLKFERHPSSEVLDDLIFLTQTYQHILALVFAVKEINEDPQVLYNISLGFNIYDVFFTGSLTYLASLELLSTWGKFIPNYKCDVQSTTVAVIGGPDSKACLFMATTLSIYKIPQDDNGLRFMQKELPRFSQSGICFDFIEPFPTVYFKTGIHEMMESWVKLYVLISDSIASVVILHSEIHTTIFLRMFPRILEVEDKQMKTGKVWVMMAQIEFTSVPFQQSWDLDILHGSLAFAIQSDEVVGFQNFLQRRNPNVETRDGFIKDFWRQAFDCSFPTTLEDNVWTHCSGEEKLEALPRSVFDMSITPHSYSIYNAVYAVAHALKSMSSSMLKHRTISEEGLKNVLNSMLWQVQPRSLCNKPCRKGHSKTKKEGKPFCCYDCFPCPEGKVSNWTDMDSCYQCPEDHYPSKAQDQCIPKEISFLFFQEPLGITLAIVVLLFSSITALILAVFVQHKNTPIVKANNQGLSYTLLVSLLLSFLCPLLFIGHPQKVTCLFRQTAFGIIFSVAVSCVVAKTLIVVLAFMATRPDSKMRSWVGNKLALFMVPSCSIVQTTLCTVWLVNSAPFPDLDMHSLPTEIVLECNEGSTAMFYCVLGFIGLLAMISFTVAFLGRNLPDSFNEAKFITLSMLLFCSVWISFVPAYQSTKGKYMVAVEIFSILASSAGLLTLIFFPKVYIILIRPELNNRQQLMQKTLMK
ncbi:PREDICTED: extracellular calcium-sensing receptor-like [Thamnophis sirtalis]|uniref:Extracellular calcium-sensing receptor-like n=1 Tax=Thamnophis sirtalis TaxID=35019 RepID=A0A6I9Y2H7_9SAUR|nr:PREDICTED: extracellular calcium-sensing receptor-like [Thamnophis sirtalis]